MTKLLVYRFSAMGDVVLLLPVLKGALEANHDLEIYFLTQSGFFPVFQNAVNGGDMFIRKITGADLLNAFVILTGSAICGSCTGNLLHSRVMKDRRLAFILTVLICIMAIVQTSVIRKVPVLKFIMWIFPPVMLPSQIYRNADFFDVRHSVSLFLIFFLYALCYAVIKSILCYRNRF